MLVDLEGHMPEQIEFCLTDSQKEMFKDVLVLCEGAKSADEPIKILRDKFNALFPDNEVVDRKYDDFEIQAIREEYCVKQENDVPKRKEELETVLAQIKTMKKNAEEAYSSALLEVSDLAARAKNGKTDFRLPSTKTARIALNGHFLFYTWVDGKFQLCKVQRIPDWDRNSLWSQEDVNRQAMKEVFGVEFPEVEMPDVDGSRVDDLPFGDDEEENDAD